MENFFSHESFLFSKDFVTFLKTDYVLMPNWKWLVLVAGWVIGLILRPILQFALRYVKARLPWSRRHPHSFSAYFLKLNAEHPTAWIVIILFWSIIADALDLTGNAEKYYGHILRILIAFQIIRLVYYVVDASGKVVGEAADKNQKYNAAMNNQIIPFATKSIKLLVVVVGVLLVLQGSGVNVMSLLAGLGIGGLTLALAAQDTAANMFGSITILSDQPCRVGDWVKVQDTEGTVEAIGFRSSRIRTFSNSLVTIPNSVMAKAVIENMSMRTSSRTQQELNLSLYNPPDVIDAYCQRLREMLGQQQFVKADSNLVTISNIKITSITILVQFFVELPGLKQEAQIKQNIFMQIMRIADEMKIDFAIPLQMDPPTVAPAPAKV